MRRREFIAGLSGAVAWPPIAARAQQPKMPVIGYLNSSTESNAQHFTTAFRRGLSEIGYVEGQNVSIEYHWMEGQYDRLSALAADLVRRRVALIVATGGTAIARAAKSATATIPIVFVGGGDPVEVGLVASLNRPGGNVTGAAVLTKALTAKRLELLHELVPAATPIGFLVNPTNPTVFKAEMMEAETAARALGVRLVILNASTLSEIEAAFEILVAQRIGALLTSGDPLWTVQRVQLAAFTARYAVPAIYAVREIVDAGGLLSYGANISDAYRLVGVYAGRILKGEKPADLPVQQATKVEFVINLRTAKALGLTIPETLLATADEVIQ
jgi:putative tryptophan/tyrosine transport system substrate-binding protein